LTIPNTGTYQTWANVTATVTLGAGVQSMRVVADRNGPTGVFGNLNWVELVAAGPAPFGGTPRALPGRLEAEHFDDGGEGIAYHDTTVGNTGGSLRNTDVDLQGTTDVGGGYNVGWITRGEWLTYTVSVAHSGTYTLTARVAAKAAGGTFHIEFGGVNRTGPLTIPNTGTYQTWANVTATVTLGAGVQSMRVVADRSGPTGVFGNLNWIGLVASGWVMTAPAPGTTLVSRTATFQWTGSGDEFWLTIGSVPGGADVYESGSLGQETQHTVTGLPLNGMTLYVQLHRRLAAATNVLNVQDAAPIRKALLVITDFADRRLEDWSGEGMNTIDDVSVQLREMEAHWAWLSRGRERIRWDIVRVTLTQQCVARALGWSSRQDTVLLAM
jgi:hypothetical protein